MSSIIARIAIATTAVAAAAALVLAATPMLSDEDINSAGHRAAAAHQIQGRTDRELSAPRDRQLLIIGASYTAGWGATSPSLDYAHRLAAALNWPTTISAEPGAGYVSTGNNGHDDFAEQIDALPAGLHPGLILIQGGRDDDGQPAAREYAAGTRTIDMLRAKYDDPEIVMVGDIPASLPVGETAIATSSTLQQVATAEHVVFINPIREHWMTAANLPGFHSPIPGHPNDAGHAYIAYRLVQDLGFGMNHPKSA